MWNKQFAPDTCGNLVGGNWHMIRGTLYRLSAGTNAREDIVPRGKVDQREEVDLSGPFKAKEGPPYLESLQKLIPGEAIAVYFLAQSLSKAVTDTIFFENIAGLTAVCVSVLVRIFQSQDMTALKPWTTVQWHLVISSGVCCMIWIHAVGGEMFLPLGNFPDTQIYAQFFGFVYAALAPILLKALGTGEIIAR
jgi:hypothetical protein